MRREYARTITVEASDCDLNMRLRLATLFRNMQDVATLHAASFGKSRDELIESGAVWVLSRVQVEMKRMPAFGEKVVFRTHTGSVRKLLFPRWFEFETEQGEKLGAASTVWFLVSEKNHTVLSPAKLGLKFDDEDPETLPLPLPGKLILPDMLELADVRRASYSDIDCNGHVNNARYVEWVFDALPLERTLGSPFLSFSIAYKAEAKPGQNVQLDVGRHDHRYTVAGRMDGVTSFEAQCG